MYPTNNERITQANLNWCEYNQKNKPQGNAVATGLNIFSSTKKNDLRTHPPLVM